MFGDPGALGIGQLVAEQVRLRLNQAADAPVADGKQSAELVDDLVGIEADRPGVVADERTGEDPRRPAREVVAFQAFPQIDPDLGDRGDGIERNAAPFALRA